jgi:hypothetical protein
LPRTYGRRVDRSDFTCVRGYDALAQEIGWLFPEYADAAKLWAFLLSPYDRLPDRGRLYRRAFEEVASEQSDTEQTDLEPVPF